MSSTAKTNLRRRRLLWLGVGGASLVGIAAWQRNAILRAALARQNNEQVALSPSPEIEGPTCVLTAEQTDGPFFFNGPQRRNIREDRVGLPFELTMQVVSATDCQPVSGARVEIWHCDAEGRYSGYREDLTRSPFDTLLALDGPETHVEPINTKTYLRGAQTSDAQGLVTFDTIFPGWYEPRVTHIHVKVFHQQNSYLTTQLYFPDTFSNAIYSQHSDYKPHGTSPYHHHNDVVLGTYPAADGVLVQPVGDHAGLQARLKLGIT